MPGAQPGEHREKHAGVARHHRQHDEVARREVRAVQERPRGALAYYHYCAFAGYAALPFLENTTAFLYPAYATMGLTPVALLCGFNPTRFVLSIYFHDVLG